MKININIYEKIDNLFKSYYQILEDNKINKNILFNDDFFKMILKKFKIDNNIKNIIYEKYKKKFGKYNKILKKAQNTKIKINANVSVSSNDNIKAKNQTNTQSENNNSNYKPSNNFTSNSNTNKSNNSNNTFQYQNKSNDYDINNNVIKQKSYLIKLKEKIFKKIALKCHPDRSRKYKDGILFTEAREHFNNNLIIGLIYICIILDIDLRFIKLESNLVDHMLEEIRILLEEINIIDEIKNN